MVWGFLIALVLVVGVVFVIMAVSNKQINIVSLIVALVLWVILSFETNGLINSLSERSETTDFVNTILYSLSGYCDIENDNSVISSHEANEIALCCKLTMSSWSRYFSASDFQGKLFGEIPDIISNNVDKAMRRSVWNSVGWIVLTLLIGTVAIVLFLNVGQKNIRGGRQERDKYRRNNERYHSRRN